MRWLGVVHLLLLDHPGSFLEDLRLAAHELRLATPVLWQERYPARWTGWMKQKEQSRMGPWRPHVVRVAGCDVYMVSAPTMFMCPLARL